MKRGDVIKSADDCDLPVHFFAAVARILLHRFSRLNRLQVWQRGVWGLRSHDCHSEEVSNSVADATSTTKAMGDALILRWLC
jgi:hypothetical protein